MVLRTKELGGNSNRFGQRRLTKAKLRVGHPPPDPAQNSSKKTGFRASVQRHPVVAGIISTVLLCGAILTEKALTDSDAYIDDKSTQLHLRDLHKHMAQALDAKPYVAGQKSATIEILA